MAVRFRFTRLLVLFAVLAVPMRASADPTSDTEALITAAETLIKRLDGNSGTAAPPTLTNDGGPIVRTAYDENVLRAMPLDLNQVSRSCIGIGNSIVAYVNYANRSAKGAPDPTAASEAKLAQLQNELTAGSIAANLCVQKGFRAVAGFATTLTPEQRVNVRDALAQMRAGGAQTISSSVASAASPSISLANRARLLAAVIEDLRFTAASYTPADRSSLRKQVLAITPQLPPTLAKQARDIAAVLAGTDCNLLCQIGS